MSNNIQAQTDFLEAAERFLKKTRRPQQSNRKAEKAIEPLDTLVQMANDLKIPEGSDETSQLERSIIQVFSVLVSCHRKLGKTDEALHVLDDLGKLLPENTETWITHAQFHNTNAQNDADYGRALQYCDKAASLNKNPIYPILEKVKIYKEKDDYPSAHRELDQVLETNPESDEAWHLKGVLHKDKGEDTQAARCFTKSIETGTPKSLGSFDRLVALHIGNKNFKSALEVYDLFPKSAERTIDQDYKKGLILAKLGRYDESLTLLSRFLQQHTPSKYQLEQCMNTAGIIHFHKGAAEIAKGLFENFTRSILKDEPSLGASGQKAVKYWLACCSKELSEKDQDFLTFVGGHLRNPEDFPSILKAGSAIQPDPQHLESEVDELLLSVRAWGGRHTVENSDLPAKRPMGGTARDVVFHPHKMG